MFAGRTVSCLLLALVIAVPAVAAEPADVVGDRGTTNAVKLPGGTDQGAQATAVSSQAPPADDPDLDIDPLQTDFTLVTMPTTLRMPRWKSGFRVTHRFTRSLGQGSFGSLAEDFFGIDAGAAIGLEYRLSLLRGSHVGFRRTNDRTIEFSAQYILLLQERESKLVGLSAIASVDGTNNFRDSYTPALGVVVSRSLPGVGTVYAMPVWVNNSNPNPSEVVDDNDAFLLGLGTRLRIRPSVYLVGEIIPRVAGYDPGVNQATFGVEKLLGLHVFQLSVSNGFGTTMGQVARGGFSSDDWYLGFSIARKFF